MIWIATFIMSTQYKEIKNRNNKQYFKYCNTEI